MRALQLLGLMFGANERQARKVAFSEFYNQALSDSMDVQDEYIAWRRSKVRACTALLRKKWLIGQVLVPHPCLHMYCKLYPSRRPFICSRKMLSRVLKPIPYYTSWNTSQWF